MSRSALLFLVALSTVACGTTDRRETGPLATRTSAPIAFLRDGELVVDAIS